MPLKKETMKQYHFGMFKLVGKEMISQQQYIENQPVMIYLNWNAFAAAIWKRGTLKTLLERPYMVCSTDQRLEREKIKISSKSIS